MTKLPDNEYDREYCAQLKAYKQWESKSPKERATLSLPEDMERPRRRCHVVVNATIEALIGAMRDNPQGMILYSDELESLFANFNRYNSSDESYFLSAFSGTPFKYIRKSADEHIFLPNPYCSIIGSTQKEWAKQLRAIIRKYKAESVREDVAIRIAATMFSTEIFESVLLTYPVNDIGSRIGSVNIIKMRDGGKAIRLVSTDGFSATYPMTADELRCHARLQGEDANGYLR